jgi:hypothetical protein
MWREKGEKGRRCLAVTSIFSLNRFWLYIKLFAIISVVWFVEIKSDLMIDSHESVIISDVIKCFSAGLAAYLLIWTPQVHTLVFKRYNTIKDDDPENNES